VTTLWHAPAALLAVLTWLTAPPATVGELAQREALRRALTVESTGVYTNDSLPYMPPPVMADAPAAVEPLPELMAIAPPPPPPGTEPPAEPEETRDQAWWSNRIESARAALDRDQVLADAMQSRVGSLQTDIVNRDDPAQRALLQLQLQRALNETARLAKQIELDEQAIKDIQDEARKQRVPPGWVR
jgi:hypothetical protein